MKIGNKIQILGHGKVGKPYSAFSSFYFGRFTLIFMWTLFIGLLILFYIFTFHTQSDFEKESYKLKSKRNILLNDRQLEQKKLSDLQSLQRFQGAEDKMIEAGEVEYIR